METEKICLLGTEIRRKEFSLRLPELKPIYEGEYLPSYDLAETCDVFVDLNLDEHPERIPFYFQQKGVLLGSSVKKSLLQQMAMYEGERKAAFIGMNALPTFINRPVWEVAVHHEDDVQFWAQLASDWGVEIQLVEDRLGMVTPRIIFPIINEAFLMWQEGTAGPKDIDVAMKLGTNYPEGPIAWAEKIGLSHVEQLLQLLHEDTGAARFAPCRLLREKSLKSRMSH